MHETLNVSLALEDKGRMECVFQIFLLIFSFSGVINFVHLFIVFKTKIFGCQVVRLRYSLDGLTNLSCLKECGRMF